MFDVESAGLHGDGFAYGYVVTGVDKTTGELTVLDEGEKYSIEGGKQAQQHEWVAKNVLPSLPLTPFLDNEVSAEPLPETIVPTNRELRDAFFKVYSDWKSKGAEIYSDVNWPVETGFLSAVMQDDLPARNFAGPFPLKDASHVLCHIEPDPMKLDRWEYARLPGARRPHNPLDDAKASAFALHKAKHELKKKAVGTEIGDGAAIVKSMSESPDRGIA